MWPRHGRTRRGTAPTSPGSPGVFSTLEHAATVESAVRTYNGFSIRVTRAYDITHKKSIISLDTLYGINVIRPEHVVLIKGADKA